MSAIGPKRTCLVAVHMSAFGVIADIGAGVFLPAFTRAIQVVCDLCATAVELAVGYSVKRWCRPP